MSNAAARFAFIGHALRGDGPFRPAVSTDSVGGVTLASTSYLDRYPRESDTKFARRNAVAFYASPLGRACSRFAGYLSTRAPQRDFGHEMYSAMGDDIDGMGNSLDMFLQQFMVNVKARGSMLLLVDMPSDIGLSQGDQLSQRKVPTWTAIEPESLVEYAVGDDGKFDFVTFGGEFVKPSGERVPCIWYMDREKWEARDESKAVLAADGHPLKECPVLICTEQGKFPAFGPFSSIADLSKRMFNLDSELDEILRSQTFSLLTMQVPEGSTDAQKLSAAKVAGETVGTQNLMVHSGSTPAFIAPAAGPANVYMERIKDIRSEIDAVGLNVATVNERESGLAMQHRFQVINAELARFAGRIEDLERRAWELSKRWLGFTKAPTTQWPRDYNLADVEQELRILAEMQAGGMPTEVLAEQQRRIVSVQFGGLDPDRLEIIAAAIDERLLERKPTDPNPNQGAAQ